MSGVAPFPVITQQNVGTSLNVGDGPQPIPTAGVLSIVDRANQDAPYSGGGGGGNTSTIGPNIAVSTLNVNSQGYIQMFQDNTNSSGRIIGYGDVNNTSSLSLAVGFVAGYASKINGTDGLWCVENDAVGANQAYGDFGAGRFAVLGNNAGASKPVPVLDSDGAGNLDINADGAVNISTTSFTVNGAPVGGGGPNLVVSTLSVNDTGNITLDWNNGGGTLNFGFEATNTSSFILQQGIGVVGTKVAGPEGCIQVLEKDGGANQVFAPLQASGFEVCATAYPGGAFAGLYFSSIGSVLYSAVGQPLTIDAPAGVSVSSLSVSSINGSAPGGGSAPFFSTLNQSPSTINCDGNTTQVLLSFSTTAGHLYQIQTQMTIQGNGGQEGTLNDDVVQELINEINLNTTQGSFISTANAAARDVGIGTCGMWKSNLTGTSLAISGTFSTTVQLGDVYLTDFGPV